MTTTPETAMEMTADLEGVEAGLLGQEADCNPYEEDSADAVEWEAGRSSVST